MNIGGEGRPSLWPTFEGYLHKLHAIFVFDPETNYCVAWPPYGSTPKCVQKPTKSRLSLIHTMQTI